jgi:hypothetical protein
MRSARCLTTSDLLSGRLSQRFIDSLLPTRPILLEVIQNVTINPQRYELFGIRE